MVLVKHRRYLQISLEHISSSPFSSFWQNVEIRLNVNKIDYKKYVYKRTRNTVLYQIKGLEL